jgi:hypothetical protein
MQNFSVYKNILSEAHVCNLSALRQEGGQLEASLGCRVRSCLNETKQKQRHPQGHNISPSPAFTNSLMGRAH